MNKVHRQHRPVILVILESIKELQAIPNASRVIPANIVSVMVLRKIAQLVIGAQVQP